MDQSLLSSRAVIGMYYEALAAANGIKWIDGISNLFGSDQESETYPWLGMPPAMREWIGGRQAKGLSGNSINIINKHFEATMAVALKDMRRDKTGQLKARLTEFATRGQTHYASLLSTLIANGGSSLCYDGQYFFDTDHSEGKSGTLDNDITTDISAVPAEVHGVITAPSKEEMLGAITKSISQFFTFTDDQGEPINEDAQSFLVMVPVGLHTAARNALSSTNVIGPGMASMDGYKIELAVNPRLTAAGWTDEFVTFRTDGSIKPLIRQEETSVVLKVKDENSEHAFDNDEIQIGIDGWHNVGYGRWQGAVLNTLV
ncbi:MAG: Mu-like prophage major head subunit gpT family protein [Sideroxydans sp.]|jgi:phage major head subunit gpT-like protein